MSRWGALSRGLADFRKDVGEIFAAHAHAGGSPKRQWASTLLDMRTAVSALLRSSIALREATGRTWGTRSVLRFVYHIDVWTDQIGAPLTLPHPFNIVIGGGVRIGDGCTILHNVTLAHARETSIGDRVTLGVGSTVLPNVHIGNGGRCGAGAVVTRDVPASVTVVGVPAAPVERAVQKDTRHAA